MKLISALALASLAVAQEPTIRTNVPLVVVSTGVSDSKGRPVEGLSASDFIVLDEGKPRAVHVDISDPDTAPVALVVAIQASGFSDPAVQKIRKTGGSISESVLGANGEAAVLAFDDTIRIVQDFTRDADRIDDAIATFKSAPMGGGPRLIDAVDKSIELLSHRNGPRRAYILLISEGKDNGSKLKLPDVLSELQRSGVTIYAANYSAYLTAFTTKPKDYTPPEMADTPGVGNSVSIPAIIMALAQSAHRNTAEAFTSATGGRRLTFETVSKLETDLEAIANDIHTRYLISFTPDATPEPVFHRLEIRIRNRPDAVVRARPGYWTDAAQ